ncbi:hypothetical protein FPOAC2_01244 [Fusarium poae]|uniref:Uncharacterized protein n=1 Tax=Fusarium poae TaxID=36050 RepID=A0A1B8B388_FUSPO|nr:hypothetical protein FPOAC1_001174 [Fusarium poae]KAG8675197.1 hypothetical protein FPOAC1_001174 [Fusarium poae]OBS27183.1 hypothetical protein FPOA_01124 [Fusarium poae]
MGKNSKQSKWADRVDEHDHYGYDRHGHVQDPAEFRSMLYSEFFGGLHKEHTTGEITQHTQFSRSTLYTNLFTFDTSRFPPPTHATSISTEFRTLADSMLRLAHAMGTGQEWLALMDFQGAFRVRYNGIRCAMKTDCIPLDISIMITRLYALVVNSGEDTTKTNDFLGLDYLFHHGAQMETTFDVCSSDCEQYWTLKFIELGRRVAKGAAACEANTTVKLYLYFLVAKMPQVLERH